MSRIVVLNVRLIRRARTVVLARIRNRTRRSSSDTFRQGIAFDELQYQVPDDIGLSRGRRAFREIVDGRDIGVVERGDRLRLAMKSSDSFRVAGVRIGQDLDGDAPIEPGVVGRIDFAHAARAERAEDFIRPETRTDYERHGLRANILALPAGPHPRRVLTMMPRLGHRRLGSAWPQALMPPAPSALTISCDPRRAPITSGMAPLHYAEARGRVNAPSWRRVRRLPGRAFFTRRVLAARVVPALRA